MQTPSSKQILKVLQISERGSLCAAAGAGMSNSMLWVQAVAAVQGSAPEAVQNSEERASFTGACMLTHMGRHAVWCSQEGLMRSSAESSRLHSH